MTAAKAFALNLTQAVIATPPADQIEPMVAIVQQSMQGSVICGRDAVQALRDACDFALGRDGGGD